MCQPKSEFSLFLFCGFSDLKEEMRVTEMGRKEGNHGNQEASGYPLCLSKFCILAVLILLKRVPAKSENTAEDIYTKATALDVLKN